jgi:hypothetical protein
MEVPNNDFCQDIVNSFKEGYYLLVVDLNFIPKFHQNNGSFIDNFWHALLVQDVMYDLQKMRCYVIDLYGEKT